MNRVYNEPAYVLHLRDYRESSALVSVFTLNFGRMAVVARGVKRPRSPWKSSLQPFRALMLSWQGRTELKNLTDVETRPSSPLPTGQRRLYCGFYINELVERLLPVQDPHPELFGAYVEALADLECSSSEEVALRRFEQQLVTALGYGFRWDLCMQPEGRVRPDRYYGFHPEQGLIEASPDGAMLTPVAGATLLAVAEERWSDPGARQTAKRVMRVLIDHLLGGKPLHSRRLFSMRAAGPTGTDGNLSKKES